MDLNPGEVICDRCNGETFIRYTEQLPDDYPMKRVCDKCNGEGKLDWIERVVGKKQKELRRPIGTYIKWEWNKFEDDPLLKMTSNEIKQSINPEYRKLVERRVAYEKY